MRQPTRSDYRHKSTPNNSAWRRGCRCPDCVTAHRTWLQQQRDSGVTRKQYRRPVPLCPVHDAETFDVCLCGGR